MLLVELVVPGVEDDVDVEVEVEVEVLLLVLGVELVLLGVLELVLCEVELGGAVDDLVAGGAERCELEVELELLEPPPDSA